MLHHMTNEELIEKKKAEIKDYERILHEYQSGRWYDMGKRHLDSLREELEALERTDNDDER